MDLRATTLMLPAMLDLLRTFGLFAITALAEIAGCYFVYLWLKKDQPAWWLIPATLSLAVFAWLLTLHPQASGRVYAAYGGVYIAAALVWLWAVDRVTPAKTDWIGVALCLIGMAVILLGPKDS